MWVQPNAYVAAHLPLKPIRAICFIAKTHEQPWCVFLVSRK